MADITISGMHNGKPLNITIPKEKWDNKDEDYVSSAVEKAYITKYGPLDPKESITSDLKSRAVTAGKNVKPDSSSIAGRFSQLYPEEKDKGIVQGLKRGAMSMVAPFLPHQHESAIDPQGNYKPVADEQGTITPQAKAALQSIPGISDAARIASGDIGGEIASYVPALAAASVATYPKVRAIAPGFANAIKENPPNMARYGPASLLGGAVEMMRGGSPYKGMIAGGALEAGVEGAATGVKGAIQAVRNTPSKGASYLGRGQMPPPKAEYIDPSVPVQMTQPPYRSVQQALPPGPERVFNMGDPQRMNYPPGTEPEVSQPLTMPPRGLPVPTIIPDAPTTQFTSRFDEQPYGRPMPAAQGLQPTPLLPAPPKLIEPPGNVNVTGRTDFESRTPSATNAVAPINKPTAKTTPVVKPPIKVGSTPTIKPTITTEEMMAGQPPIGKPTITPTQVEGAPKPNAPTIAKPVVAKPILPPDEGKLMSYVMGRKGVGTALNQIANDLGHPMDVLTKTMKGLESRGLVHHEGATWYEGPGKSSELEVPSAEKKQPDEIAKNIVDKAKAKSEFKQPEQSESEKKITTTPPKNSREADLARRTTLGEQEVLAPAQVKELAEINKRLGDIKDEEIGFKEIKETKDAGAKDKGTSEQPKDIAIAKPHDKELTEAGWKPGEQVNQDVIGKMKEKLGLDFTSTAKKLQEAGYDVAPSKFKRGYGTGAGLKTYRDLESGYVNKGMSAIEAKKAALKFFDEGNLQFNSSEQRAKIEKEIDELEDKK